MKGCENHVSIYSVKQKIDIEINLQYTKYDGMDLSSFLNDSLNCSFDEAMRNEILNSLSLFLDEKKYLDR